MSNQLFQAALQHHQAGRLSQAEMLYRQILQLEPNHPDALHLLGAIARQAGDKQGAADLIGRAIKAKPDEPVFYNSMGLVLRDLGKAEEAIACYHEALSLRLNYAETYYNLANLLQALGKIDEAVDNYQKAVSFKPDDAEAYNNMGNALQSLGKLDEAANSYREALAIKPRHAEAHSNLGNVLHARGMYEDAIASYRQALSFKPNSFKAHYNLGIALQAQGKLDAAIECYRKALSINPDLADAHYNLGNALRKQGNLDAAAEEFNKVISLDPNHIEAYSDLGSTLRFQGKMEESFASYRKALSIKPDFADARWKLAMSRIPVIAASLDEIEACRAMLPREIAELDDWFDAGRIALGHVVVGTSQPFYLAYQERNNRDILLQYGTLCARLMKHWQDRQDFPAAGVAQGGAVRVGIVSAHIRGQSVWDAIVKGWFQHLDRNRIELHVFNIGSKQDDETAWAKSLAASFVQDRKDLQQWVETILEKQVDVLIYPEIGMSQMTVKLASLRLAPIQIASWGHPETTGLPTMDYYLSAEYLESADAQNNYSEQLIRLPNLGCHYHPAQVTSSEPDFATLGIKSGVPLLLCPGTPYKYAPQYDHVLVEIARKLGRCQFVFFTYRIPGLSGQLRQRLESAFSRGGMDFNDYCTFIPWQEKSAFYGLMKRADVLLDTIGFSGFNTAMQAVECGLPVITREGRFMRGKLASGILRRMGITELVAGTEEEYVNLAARLALDAEYRQQIKYRIEKSRPVLFDDAAPVKALEDFLISAVAHKRDL